MAESPITPPTTSPFDDYLTAWQRYADFSGRACRREYWYFMLFNILISLGLSFIDAVIGLGNPEVGMGLLSGLYGLSILLPSLAYAARRLHDSGRSGWWLLLLFMPLLGPLVILLFTLLDSEAGSNRYGANPKGIDATSP